MDFVLYRKASEIAAQGSSELAESWLRTAANYVVTHFDWEFENVFNQAIRGFVEGWKIFVNADLTEKGLQQYLNEAVVLGNIIEAIPTP